MTLGNYGVVVTTATATIDVSVAATLQLAVTVTDVPAGHDRASFKVERASGIEVTDDLLFLHTIRDLSHKVNLGTEYDWLKASALVRLLLIDGHPLAGRVNRAYQLKLHFEVPDATGYVDEHTAVYMAGDTLLGVHPMRTVDWDGFLKAPLIYIKPRWFTTHEIVDTVAHVLGGVHRGDPDPGSQEDLAALDAGLQLLGGDAAKAQMRGIGHMTIRGLKPLAEAVAKRHGVSITWTSPEKLRYGSEWSWSAEN